MCWQGKGFIKTSFIMQYTLRNSIDKGTAPIYTININTLMIRSAEDKVYQNLSLVGYIFSSYATYIA